MTTVPNVSVELVIAVDEAGVIGNAGALPWKYPADLRRFRDLTGHCPVIVGRTTMDDIVRRAGVKPVLPTRQPVVVSRTPYPGYPTAPSVADAVGIAAPLSTGQVMVIGGLRVYLDALRMTETATIHLTRIPGVHEGDVRMPDGWLDGWTSVEEAAEPDGLVFATLWRSERAAWSASQEAQRFCRCAGSAWRPEPDRACREGAERVIGTPLRARIEELVIELAHDRAETRRQVAEEIAVAVEDDWMGGEGGGIYERLAGIARKHREGPK